MGQGHAALIVVDQNGLHIALVVAAGGAVAHMTHGNVSLAQRIQPLLGEHLADQTHIPVRSKYSVIIHHNARALLSAVLQRIQGIIGQRGYIGRLLGIDAENSALLVDVPVAPIHISAHHGPAVSS